jgi:hypothetical protein
MEGWDKAHLSEIEAVSGPGSLQWTPVRRHFEARADEAFDSIRDDPRFPGAS